MPSAFDRQTTSTVLIIEDEPALRELMASVLRDEGFEVELASDGATALRGLRSGRLPDLILLDPMSPHMDGWGFRTAQKADAQLDAIPVIAMSSDASAQAQGIDADLFLRKPFEPDELVLSVRRVLLDRDRRRLQERLQQAEQLLSLGTLAASIGHEIRNPLTYLVASLAELERCLLTERPEFLKELLHEARQGAARIMGVINTMGMLSRNLAEQRVPVALDVLLESAINMTSHWITGRAQLVKRFEGAPTVVGNEAQLAQVFINLLTNAAQAIAPGATATNEISVSAGRRKDEAFVEVSDTGMGIPPEIQGRIYDPFFTTKAPGAGTGLGLAISRNIVAQHGGRIELQSAPGSGSTFRVFLPIARAERRSRERAAGNAG